MLWAVGSLGNVWARIFGGITVRNTNQEKIKMANHGDGLSCGMSLGVVGGHQSLA